ncbi:MULTISPECIES: glycosyltransferase family 25 protein [unclassified Shewanella]|jgi:glycosyl transferase family 25|uniref:glycosyltransferase family 25 protein n=1 Tax=unclassified Shewanella TaxID=196818 RepID=UPI00137C1725|nr:MULTISPECIES: glycosyltransferase family 25 protein [unclassified Shewanella]MBB1364409.1 glycosyltransferase family 25 protein [Shewanella sp. SR44-4]QHS15272.1 glycosyltransferase family 25 protein [Shewanella sp. Arc9-LZ]
MKCKVFLINLDNSTERFTFMDEQLKQLGIEYQRISAVYGKDLHDIDIAKVYDPQTNLQKYDKKLNLGEIGCYLSHVQCWQMIIEQQLDYALILEDDSILDPALMTVIQHINNLSADWDYIKLCHGRKPKGIVKSIVLDERFSLSTCLKLPASTRGQCVSFAGAQKLLATAYPIARPVDIDIQFWFEKQLRCFVVRPFPVIGTDLDSDINRQGRRTHVERHHLLRIWQKVKFELKLLKHKQHLPSLPRFNSNKP